MRYGIKFFLLMCVLLLNSSCTIHQPYNNAVTRAIPIHQLKGYKHYPPATNQLIIRAKRLSQQHLGYRFGAANPKSGGMDCSGVLYYLLKQSNVQDVPRQAHSMYSWVQNHGKLYPVKGRNLAAAEFSKLRPGDLLFWTGTYKTHNTPPITHVMLYLGKNKQNQPLMFGANDGFPYRGEILRGVSVYDFILPNAASAGRLVAYGCIPHLNC